MCHEKGKKYYFQKGDGINIVFGLNYILLVLSKPLKLSGKSNLVRRPHKYQSYLRRRSLKRSFQIISTFSESKLNKSKTRLPQNSHHSVGNSLGKVRYLQTFRLVTILA
jgi:hypothetical protein